MSYHATAGDSPLWLDNLWSWAKNKYNQTPDSPLLKKAKQTVSQYVQKTVREDVLPQVTQYSQAQLFPAAQKAMYDSLLRIAPWVAGGALGLYLIMSNKKGRRR